eukprot:10891348-Alexandrium_andersonii.AAC.1
MRHGLRLPGRCPLPSGRGLQLAAARAALPAGARLRESVTLALAALRLSTAASRCSAPTSSRSSAVFDS